MKQHNQKAVIYDRISAANQLRQPVELVWQASEFGFAEDEIEVITDAASGVDERSGYDRLRGLIAQGEVGLVLVNDPSRISRSAEDYASFRTACGAAGTLIYDGSTETVE